MGYKSKFEVSPPSGTVNPTRSVDRNQLAASAPSSEMVGLQILMRLVHPMFPLVMNKKPCLEARGKFSQGKTRQHTKKARPAQSLVGSCGFN